MHSEMYKFTQLPKFINKQFSKVQWLIIPKHVSVKIPMEFEHDLKPCYCITDR